MNPPLAVHRVSAPPASPVAVAIRADENGPPLAVERVLTSDLALALSEAWRDDCLRQGYPDLALSELPMRVWPRPHLEDPGSRCSGFTVEVALPDGRVRHRDFSLASLATVAERAARGLIAGGILAQDGVYRYDLVPETLAGERRAVATGKSDCTVNVRPAPLTYLRRPLGPLLEQARPVALSDDGSFPVFFTAEALAESEGISRRGAQAVPPVESGGLLSGSLAVCPVTGELFLIVDAALPVEEAEEKAFSISLTGTSWHRVQTIMGARQSACPEQAIRLLGQSHGHNFVPGDGRRCAECDRRAVCDFTSVFVSPSDHAWMASVFARLPWSLCLIFGLNARQEPVSQLFTLRDGRWLPRGYYVLPSANP